ncbi:hypothetical protein MUK42_03599 [Musa troglodytarum]|uniref:Uncharacterized protein n=1 Tax=Musa troglodytarum TaxID=320322 RepID=A0A9E7HKR8_9LILI|nr:hypothetical protein MUK42_03599 [Musa troglodytarum]
MEGILTQLKKETAAPQPKARPASRGHLLRVDMQITRFLL